MQAQSTVTKCLAAILFTVGAAASFPLHSQGAADPRTHWVAPPPPFLLGMASGAQFGGVSAANPTLRCFTGSLPHTSNPHPPDSSHGAWIADSWQHFGGPRRDSAERSGAEGSQFVEKWQQFLEPAR